MPKQAWQGYKRFCPLARGLDIVGDRWTLVIVQELLAEPKRYTDLARRLPGIGTTVLAERLRKLERLGLIERRADGVGEPVRYHLGEAGKQLEEPLRAFREWGVRFLVQPDADRPAAYDTSYVHGYEDLPEEVYELRVDETVCTLRFSGGELIQTAGSSDDAVLVVATDSDFMRRWSAGSVDWEAGRRSGEVSVAGDLEAWPRLLAASGYSLSYEA